MEWIQKKLSLSKAFFCAIGNLDFFLRLTQNNLGNHIGDQPACFEQLKICYLF